MPAGDGGGGSAPVCLWVVPEADVVPVFATITLETPECPSWTQTPPTQETNSTQYDPEAVKQPGG